MQIAFDSGRITDDYAVDKNCPWCKMSKLRHDLEFHVVSFERGQAVESTQAIKNVCVHCLTVCDDLPEMDFLCAKCGQLTLFSGESTDSEWKLFTRVMSPDRGFEEFYKQLLEDGLKVGKRFCLNCTNRIWSDYRANSDALEKEMDKPRPDFSLKKT